jgi:hypothetical protein
LRKGGLLDALVQFQCGIESCLGDQFDRLEQAAATDAIGEAGGAEGEGVGQEGGVGCAAHHVAAGGEGAERIAVVALPPGDEASALGLADLEEVLAGKLDGSFVAFGA